MVELGLRALAHRGPDDEGIFEDSRVVLGHRRLSILDVEGGHQPLGAAESGIIVYNGELYGFQGVRQSLDPARLQTRSDTEVLLRLLMGRGLSGLDSVNGMYAFAQYDGSARRTYLGIDLLGIKPLYACAMPGFVLFSSELRSLAEMMRECGIALRLDQESLAQYLRYGWVKAPRSILFGVHKFEPGECWTVLPDGGIQMAGRSLPPAAQEPIEGLGQARQRFVETLDQVVADQLLADVPVGVFLSGGIDSSLVLGSAARCAARLPTFSIGFRQIGENPERFDESDVARVVASYFKSDHHEIQVQPDDVFGRLDAVRTGVDEPNADPAVIPLDVLAGFASRHVKVCLSGDGGDELFGGYQHHRLRRLRAAMGESALRNTAEGAFRRLHRLSPYLGGPGRYLAIGCRLMMEPGVTPELMHEAPALLNRAWESIEQPRIDWRNVDAMLEAEFAGPLASGMLQKTDRITMRHGLEVRVPLLDERIVAFGRSVPWRYKANLFRTKILLRDALRSRLPSSLVDRPKRGFRVPLDQWFRRELRGWIAERLVPGDPLGSILGPGRAEAFLAEHTRGAANGNLLWALAVLLPWIELTEGRFADEDGKRRRAADGAVRQVR
jgi:asparagine synthase (glutamine-hydrolysing)